MHLICRPCPVQMICRILAPLTLPHLSRCPLSCSHVTPIKPDQSRWSLANQVCVYVLLRLEETPLPLTREVLGKGVCRTQLNVVGNNNNNNCNREIYTVPRPAIPRWTTASYGHLRLCPPVDCCMYRYILYTGI